jgi:hypothetical protein
MSLDVASRARPIGAPDAFLNEMTIDDGLQSDISQHI